MKESVKRENHLFPFLWMKGESSETIQREIEQIYSVGIMEFCVESRPHPDFMGKSWFLDMKLVFAEAEKRGMRVWLLDDKVFPTGYANGLVAKKYPHYLKKYMNEQHIDAFGPIKGAAFHFHIDETENERLLAAVAVSNTSDKQYILTQKVMDKTLYWDVPEGLWRVFFIFETRRGGNGKYNYLNPLEERATEALIEAVYEPHFKWFGEKFGNVFAGFFSDEPQFGNAESYFAKKARVGDYPMPLPYCDNLLEFLNEEWGDNFTACLPFLFQDIGDKFKHARYCYMNTVTKLYAKNFTGVLGKWCKAHCVEYVGHVIEDDGAHARLGAGTGHFFRALSGQTYSGIDVVLRQILPGRDVLRTRSAVGSIDSDGVFFHYTLAKLGSSLGHLNPNMKGRIFCEIFGAYGWSEGLKLMKWLTDFMLVRGVNYFVPHAYSMGTFPDPDCPPHFYAGGNNPQYRHFDILVNYMEHMGEILSGGVHKASVAVLYHAEAEWYSKCMPVDIPARELMRAQIDFDIVWSDILCNSVIENGSLKINNEVFGALIVPYCEALPYRVLKWIKDCAAQKFPIIFIQNFPKDICEMQGDHNIIDIIAENCKLVQIENLVVEIRKFNLYDVLLQKENPWIRFYRYHKQGKDYYMFFNEHPHNNFETEIDFYREDVPVVYDILTNRKYIQRGKNILRLSPYESVIYVFGEKEQASFEKVYGRPKQINPVWEISKADFDHPNRFEFYKETAQLKNIAAPEYMPNFSGILRYKTSFEWLGCGKALIDLGMVFETATLKLNGVCIGTRICPPYIFEANNLQHGKNTIEIEVINTLANQVCDGFSCTDVFEPTGLLGPVCLKEILNSSVE